jgi:hypothetical protein
VTRAPITRRRALGVIAVGAAGVAVGATGWVAGLGAPADTGRLKPGASGHLLAEPELLASRDGLLDVELTAAPLRATLPAPFIPPGPADVQRQLTFAMGMGGMGTGGTSGMGMSFTIDGRAFDDHRDDQTVRLGSTEDWTVPTATTSVGPHRRLPGVKKRG